jgi:exopolysaccharide biosynthesis polyprenyl glycosylphosphotransferase
MAAPAGGRARPKSRPAPPADGTPTPVPKAINGTHSAVTVSVARPAGREGFLLPPDWLPLALIVGDAAIVVFSVLASYWLYSRQRGQALPLVPYLWAIPVAVLFVAFAMAANGQYRSWRGRSLVDLLLASYSGVALGGLLMLAAISILNLGVDFSRFTFIYAIVILLLLVTLERYLLRQYETSLRRRGIGAERVLVVGTGAGSELLIQRMGMFPQYGFHVVGVATDELQQGSSFAGAPVLGRVADLAALLRQGAVDQVFLALPANRREAVPEVLELCERERVDFKLVPDMLDVLSTRLELDNIDGLPLMGVRRNQLYGWRASLKRTIDILASAVGLVVVSPVLLLVTVLIKVTMPGPALFRQERIGLHGQPFVIYKFRSMIVDAEAKSGPAVAVPGDSRVTRLGRVLRRLSLDELPQLYNILKGDMSIVGPRPQPTFFDRQYAAEIPRYVERQQVRPGLTGWAEVNDLRGAAPIEDRTRYDVYYIESWSLGLDVRIILLTALRALLHRHAY